MGSLAQSDKSRHFSPHAQAKKTAALFVKEGELAASMSQLHEMQHMWFQCGAGAAHFRCQDYGKVCATDACETDAGA